MDTEDDAAWVVEKHGPGEYLVRSTFARTYGPVHQTEELHRFLQPYGVWLENRGTHVEGAATFRQLESDELLYACRKLLTLERWCLWINGQVDEFINDRWEALKAQVIIRVEGQGETALVAETQEAKRRSPFPSALLHLSDDVL